MEHLNLLIIPPGTAPAANHNGPSGVIADQELSLADWDNEGGQTRQAAPATPRPDHAS
jgi:hypothetical protein